MRALSVFTQKIRMAQFLSWVDISSFLEFEETALVLCVSADKKRTHVDTDSV